jgi:phosphate transport system protein
MERHLDDELRELKKSVLDMGEKVQQAIVGSVDALKELSVEKANDIITRDREIDEWELKIDEKGLNLLALQQPMAVDLRFVAMAMKISTDLERMADLAVDIAQRVLDLAGQPLLKPLIDIPQLSAIAYVMTHDALMAFVNGDVEAAKRVILKDREADALRNAVQSELINDYISKDSATTTRAIPLLLIARHLERICDHATNIAEDVIYAVDAKIIKHHHEQLQNGRSP